MARTQSPKIQRLIGRLNAQKRWHPDQDTTPAEQDFAAARIYDYARKIMADAPALPQGHIDDITALLTKAGA